MQKKVLLSLLATAPVAFSVSAHQNVSLDNLLEVKENNDAWKFTGIPNLTYGDNQVKASQPGTSAYMELTEVWSEKKGGEMPKGLYKLNFDVLETAKILINGEEFTNGSEYNYQGGNFKIEITNSINASAYTFGKGHLQLRFDFAQEQADLNNALAALNVVELTEQNPVNEDNVSAVYQGLVAERANILENIAAIKENINKINLNATDPIPGGVTAEEYYLDIYKEYQLFADPNLIQATINQLAETVNEYNTKAQAENERYSIQETNQANLNAVLSSFKEYTDWKDSFKYDDASEYVKNRCSDEWTALEDSEFDIRNNINTTFFNESGKINDSEIVDYSALTAAIDALKGSKDEFIAEFDKATNDFNAYNEWYQANTGLNEYLKEALDALNALADKEENQYNGTRVYTDMVEQAATDMQIFIDEARAQFQIKDSQIDGAAEKLEQDLAFIDGAKSSIDEYKTGFEAKVTEQNAALTTANAAAEAARTALDEVKKTIDAKTMSESGKADADTEATRIEDLIAAEQEKINAEYLKHDLTADDYNFDDITAAINDLKGQIQADKDLKGIKDANNAWVSDLEERYNKLIGEINKTFPAEGALGGIFKTTTDNIQASIDSFNNLVEEYNNKGEKIEDNATDFSQYGNIVKNIDDTKALIEPLAEAYGKCDVSLEDMEEALERMQEAYDGKQQVKGTDGNLINGLQEKSDAWIQPFTEEYNGYKDGKLGVITDGLKAGTLTPKEAYDQIIALGTELEGVTTDFDTRADQAIVEFHQKYSKDNYSAVDAYYNAVKYAFNALGAEDYPGKAAAQSSLDDIRTILDDVRNTVYGQGTMQAPSDKPAELKVADEDCQGAYNSLVELSVEIGKLKANNEAYNAIITAWNNANQALQDAIDEVTKKTTEPARTLFLGQLEEIGKKLEGLKTQADEDYNNIASAADETGVKDEIDRISVQIPEVVTNALQNDAAHVTQLDAMKNLQADLDRFRTEIEEYDQIPNDRDKYLGQLDGVVETYDLLVKTIADAFAEGTSFINNEDIMDNIDSIRAAGQAIVDDMKGNYNQAVKDYNDKLVNDTQFGDPAMNWPAWQNYLNQAYRDAVDTYNEYHNSLQNPGFKAYMGDVITTHEGIYSYSTPIRNLIDEVGRAIQTEFTDKSEILTVEWLEENAIKPAKAIYDEMTGEVKKMQDEANAKAEEYYQQQMTDIEDFVGAAYNTMIQAGVSEELAKAATNAVDLKIGDAKAYHEIGVENGNLCVLMGRTVITVEDELVSGIATLLDEISNSTIDMNNAASQQWSNDYQGANDKIDEYLANLETYKDIVTTEYENHLNEIQAGIDELNQAATASDNLLANLSDLQAALAELLNQAAGFDADAKAANDAAVAENTAYNDFKADLGTAGDGFDDLKAWASGMAAEYLQDYSAIDAAIAEAEKYIEENRGNLTDPTIAAIAQGRIDHAKNLIDAGYAKCYGDEKNALTELDNEARRQYNEMFAGTDLTQGDALTYGNLLNAIEDEFSKLSETIGATTDRDAMRTTLLDLQSRLVNVIVEISALRGVDNPAVGILAGLNDKYNEVSAQIGGLLEGIDENVKPGFEEKAAELAAQLDAVKAAYEAEGNNVIATGNNYNKQMDGISDAATDLRAEIEKANEDYLKEQQRQQTSNTQAAALQTQLDEFTAGFQALDEFVKGAGCYDNVATGYVTTAANLQQMLTDMQTWLDAQREAFALTAESVLPGAEYFSASLAQAESMYSLLESQFQIDRATDSVNEAELLVVGAKHLDQEALETALAGLKTRLGELAVSGTIEGTTALRATVDAIVEDAEALKAEAIATVFILGDIDGNGEVDAVDLQKLLNIIAEEDAIPADDSRFKTLNINGDNDINVADAIALANIIIGETPEQIKMRLVAQPDANPIVKIQAVETAAEGGTRTIQIHLTNTVAFVGGQFDLKLPAGMSILSESLTERSEGMGMITNDFANGKHRVIILSDMLEEMDGTEGAVLELEVSGNGNIYVENAVFGDRYGHAFEGTDPGTTGIEGIFNGAMDGTKKVYDAAGRMLNKLQKGINIIVNGNGKGKKVMNRK